VEVNEYLRGKLETVSQKIDEVYSLDKKAWRELDVQKEKCGIMAAEIERVRDDMVGTVILRNYFLEVFQYEINVFFITKNYLIANHIMIRLLAYSQRKKTLMELSNLEIYTKKAFKKHARNNQIA